MTVRPEGVQAPCVCQFRQPDHRQGQVHGSWCKHEPSPARRRPGKAEWRLPGRSPLANWLKSRPVARVSSINIWDTSSDPATPSWGLLRAGHSVLCRQPAQPTGRERRRTPPEPGRQRGHIVAVHTLQFAEKIRTRHCCANGG